MSYGYSIKLVEANQQADESHLGVQLGRKCIEHGIPVSKAADDLGATRQTVYNWFCGGSIPQGEFVGLIHSYIARLPN
jgi:hypothetical protein